MYPNIIHRCAGLTAKQGTQVLLMLLMLLMNAPEYGIIILVNQLGPTPGQEGNGVW